MVALHKEPLLLPLKAIQLNLTIRPFLRLAGTFHPKRSHSQLRRHNHSLLKDSSSSNRADSSNYGPVR